MNLLGKMKLKIGIVKFLVSRVLHNLKSQGFIYTVKLIYRKKNQALTLIFPKKIKTTDLVTFAGKYPQSDSAERKYILNMVSVVIPIYDRTWEIEEAVNSIIEQSYENIEIILVMDGSPTETINTVNKFRNTDNIKIFSYVKSSGNAVRGRNKGLLESTGEYIAFLDSDDVALKDRLALSVKFLKENPDYSGVYGAWIALINGSRIIEGLTDGQIVYSPDGNICEHIENCIPCQSTVMLRKQALLDVGGINNMMNYREDHELWVRLYANGFKLKSLAEPLVRLRLHDGNNELSFKEKDTYWKTKLLKEYTKKIMLPKKIVWIVAGLGISGGLAVILKHANYLLGKGHDVSLLSLSNEDSITWYDNAVPIYNLAKDPDYILNNIDILIATAWNTEPYLEQIPTKRKLYFVQSDERRFIDDINIKKQIQQGYSKNYEYFTEAFWIQKIFHEEFACPAFYVPNGIDTSFFNESEVFEKRDLNRKRILIEGPIDIPFKAVEDSYNAVKDLDCDIWFVSSAGKPKAEWRYDKFFEKVPMYMMPKIYSSCDIFIKMSRIEGFFGPPLEAMACGCVPVVGKVSGWDEYIVHNENALAVDLYDVEAAKNSVNTLLTDSELYDRLKENGYATAKNWSWDESFNRISLLIDKI